MAVRALFRVLNCSSSFREFLLAGNLIQLSLIEMQVLVDSQVDFCVSANLFSSIHHSISEIVSLAGTSPAISCVPNKPLFCKSSHGWRCRLANFKEELSLCFFFLRRGHGKYPFIDDVSNCL